MFHLGYTDKTLVRPISHKISLKTKDMKVNKIPDGSAVWGIPNKHKSQTHD